MTSRLRPSRWPVRWRLAVASAGLTLAILLVFAGVVGYLASERVRDDFRRDLEDAATEIAARTEILATPGGGYLYRGPVLTSVAAANGATIRVTTVDGSVVRETSAPQELGGPGPEAPGEPSTLAVASAIVNDGQTVGYVEFARSEENIESTIARIWLFIAAGVLGGTLLASLAGLAVADRAMRPVGAITSTAREVASTGDPSRQMPEPRTEDEIGELTRTLAEMLHSLDAARREREEAMYRQREFVADASHELRTPLTSVLANLELLQESLQRSSGEEPEAVDSALRSSRRMSRLVGDLLILARADAGRHGPRSLCDMTEIAGDAAAEVAPMLGDRRLSQPPMPASAPVEGNRDELHRVVLNLLDNAVRHTPESALIELSVGVDDASGAATVTIADDGPGIPEELREQVFDRFARAASSADTSAGDGTGLGLAIVRSVAEAHGGDVSAERSTTGGARFTVTLPLSRRAEESMANV